MNFELASLQPKERVSFALRALYEGAGCRPYRMSRFEEYGLYQENRSFLSSEQVITFTDLDGRLLALKPDVTLSIAKSAKPVAGETLRFYYNEKVYRPSLENHAFQEISQMGLEFLGEVGTAQTKELVGLAVESLAAMQEDFMLEIGHMGLLRGVFEEIGLAPEHHSKLLTLLRHKNAHDLREQATRLGVDAAGLTMLDFLFMGVENDSLSFRGMNDMANLCHNATMQKALAELQALQESLAQYGDKIRFDFCLAGEMEYYNGLLFQGYLAGVPRAVLKGGRYDLLMQKFHASTSPNAHAVGFAVYLDALDRLAQPKPVEQETTEPEFYELLQRGKQNSVATSETDNVAQPTKQMISVALPKGRLGDKVYNLLASVGYGCPEDYNATRKLVVENPEAGIRYFLVKPSDVAIYVEHGAADVGIVGKDILTEHDPDIYELLDTGLGKCRMCVAATEDYQEDFSRPVRVATKFVEIAKQYYASQGREIDIIKLNGSIELAPILGLSDVIVDIVETGTTLRENGLQVVTEFMPISARFIANKESYQFKQQALTEMIQKLGEAIAK